MNNLSELIRPGLIAIEPSLDTADAVIQELGGLLIEGGFGKSTLVEAALERERNFPTGLLLNTEGVNAAIPHADREHVEKAAIAVAVLAEPVAFHQMDDADVEIPVRLVFLLALPDAESQLQTLRSLAGTLQNQELIARLLSCSTPEELMAVMAAGGAET